MSFPFSFYLVSETKATIQIYEYYLFHLYIKVDMHCEYTFITLLQQFKDLTDFNLGELLGDIVCALTDPVFNRLGKLKNSIRDAPIQQIGKQRWAPWDIAYRRNNSSQRYRNM